MEFGDDVVHFKIFEAMGHPAEEHSVFLEDIINDVVDSVDILQIYFLILILVLLIVPVMILLSLLLYLVFVQIFLFQFILIVMQVQVLILLVLFHQPSTIPCLPPFCHLPWS